MSFEHFLLVGAGGFLGAIARYGLSEALSELSHKLGFPAGILLVNIIGCFFIGVLLKMFETRGAFSDEVRLLLTVGFLGAFTTYSTFSHDTLELITSGKMLAAGANIALHLSVGLGAVALGRFIAGFLP